MPKDVHFQSDADGARELTPQEEMLLDLGAHLEQKFQEYSNARQHKEDEWTRAIRQYEGLWDEDDRTKIERALGYDKDTLPPPVNITRPKTNIAIARMQDIQFPVGGDFNFNLRPTPVPKLYSRALSMTDPSPELELEATIMAGPNAQAPTPAEVAQAAIDAADEAARLMEMRIKDYLIETEYGCKARRSIEDLAVLGSAVVKGPVLAPTIRKVYEPQENSKGQTVQVLGSLVEHKPEVFRVDPRLFYPDPSARMPDEMEDAFELHLMSRSKLANLGDSPAFMKSRVKEALAKGPDHTEVPSSITNTAHSMHGVVTKNRYVVKEYHGPLDKDVLFIGGIITEDDLEDESAGFFGEAWVCNGVVIRLSISYLEGVHRVPYGIASWERDPGSLFGHGVPFLLRHPQRVVNNAYMLLLDNASLTSGPQVVINKEMIEPASQDGNYDVSPMKVWFMTEYGADVREAMQFVDIPAQMGGIAQIIDMAMAFADLESSTPLIAQGEIPVGNNTLTGMGKVLSAHNINQKRASLNWDDYITKPLIQRMYHHEMQYGEDDDAKGDMDVVIGGATERIDAEIRGQELERALGLAASDPDFQIQINPTKAFRQLMSLTRAGDVLRTEKEVEAERARREQEAQQSQQADPATMQAQAAMKTAEARVAEANAKGQTAQAEIQLKQGLAQEELRLKMFELQVKREEAVSRMQQSQADREIALMQLAAKKEMDMQELQAKLQMSREASEVQRTKIIADFEKFAREVELKYSTGEGI